LSAVAKRLWVFPKLTLAVSTQIALFTLAVSIFDHFGTLTVGGQGIAIFHHIILHYATPEELFQSKMISFPVASE